MNALCYVVPGALPSVAAARAAKQKPRLGLFDDPAVCSATLLEAAYHASVQRPPAVTFDGDGFPATVAGRPVLIDQSYPGSSIEAVLEDCWARGGIGSLYRHLFMGDVVLTILVERDADGNHWAPLFPLLGGDWGYLDAEGELCTVRPTDGNVVWLFEVSPAAPGGAK